MQWADSATLELLPGLFAGEGMGHVCIVLAYRDNEVDDTHPFMLAVEELRRAGVESLALTVGPLGLSSVTALLRDALRATADDPAVGEVAGELMTKTAGNPFFVIRFIERMYQDGLLTQDEGGRWHCSLDAVRKQQYTDNVVAMMVERVQALGADTQEMLQLAACIGNHFELYDLCLASDRAPATVVQALEPAIEDGMVMLDSTRYQNTINMSLADVAVESIGYRFQHDRIQQAAYASLADEVRPQVHARIGRRWLASIGAAGLEQRIFAVVEQYNRGLEVIAGGVDAADECRRLAELNREAGQRTRGSGAFAVARNYFAYGRTWLAHADAKPSVAFAMDLSYAECCFLTGDFDTALELMSEMVGREASIGERKQLCVSTVNLHVTRGDMQAGFDASLAFLASIDIVFPDVSLAEAREHVYDDVAAALAGRPIRSLEQLSAPADERVEAALAVLSLLFLPTVFLASPVMYQSLSAMAVLSAKHGVNEDSIAGFSAFAYVLCDRRVAHYQEAYEFGLLAYDLAKKWDAKPLLPSIGVLFGDIANFYRSDLRKGRPHLYEALRVGQETGGYAFACYACNHIVINMLVAGDHLDTTWKESERLLTFVQRVGDRNIERIIVTQQRFVQCMRGCTERFGSFDGDGFSEAEFAEAIADSQMGLMILWYYIHLMGVRYLAGDWDGARAAMNKASSMLDSDLANLDQTLYFFYSALLLAQLYADEDDKQVQVGYLEEMDACIAQTRVWAESAPMNFAGWQALMEAERARVTGDMTAATVGYNRAIGEFREQRFPHYLALALERTGDFYRQQGLDEAGAVFLGEALVHYRDWGARGKVAWLLKRYPAVARPSVALSAESTQDINSDELDLASVLKASQTLSRAVRLDDLVRRLLDILRENAGAQCAYLIVLRKDGGHEIRDGETTRALADVADVAAPVVEMTRLSGEPVLISDARSDEAFRDNPVLRAHGVRSLLCLPLEWAGEVRGLLYLDNRTAPAVFTPGRVALLRSLAQQAGISVENAELYGDLEYRVAERTRELRETQREMVDMAYAAGMAQLAANTLHNLGNALNGVNLQAYLLRDDLQSLPLAPLERLAEELGRRGSDDRDFFGKLPPFVAELAADMGRRQAALQEDSESLCGMVDDAIHIL
ncbi:MAG: GAF domain-containing protein, partial [Myxococcota bacterium]